MKQSDKSLPEYIKSGEYFTDSLAWYKTKYIKPFSDRSFIFCMFVLVVLMFVSLVVNINSLFPIVTKVRYSIYTHSSENKAAQIISANKVKNDALTSVADVLLKNYVLRRENYDYDNLKSQFIFVKNNSTRIVFRKFYNFMNIDNPASPVMVLQKNGTREAKIISSSYNEKEQKANIIFESVAKNDENKIVENSIWQATINYEIDKINIHSPQSSRFNFTVVNYQLELLKNKQK